ncbi:MAG: YciI family protein [Pseudodesulfovibrio sp.]
MFIVELTYIRPIEAVEEHLEAHVVYLKEHYAKGVFLASGRKVPRTGGIILARAESERALRDVLALDPFQRNGVAQYAVTEFAPTMTAEGLEGLLD